MKPLIPILHLFRPFETTLVASTLILALLMLEIRDRTFYSTILISLWLIGAGIASWNDTLDRESDSVSHPDRPIPNGDLSVKEAKIIGSLTLVLGLLILFLTNLHVFLLAVVIVIVGVSYSISTKRFILLKNSVVTGSGIMTLTSLLWIFEKSLTTFYLFFLVSISLLLFSYEILKDIQDIDGDLKVGIKTLANTYSPKLAGGFSIVLFMLSCFIMTINFELHDLQVESLISLVTTCIIAIPGWRLYTNPSPRNSELTRYSVIFIIFTALSVISFLQMRRMEFYIVF